MAALALSSSSCASLTASRIERKYLAGAADAERLVLSLAEHLAPYHHDPRHDHPAVRHFATTIYFDTPQGCVRRAAERGGRHGKLRVREYYEVGAPTPSRSLWLELKLRDGDRACKHRLGVPRSQLPELFDAGAPRLGALANPHEASWQPNDGSRQALLDWTRSLRGPLQPSVVVNYRRRAWQSIDGSVRLTVDEDLAIFRPHPELWEVGSPWSREALGHAVELEPRCVVEVKCVEGTPAWLDRALQAVRLEACGHSKFVRGCRALRSSGR